MPIPAVHTSIGNQVNREGDILLPGYEVVFDALGENFVSAAATFSMPHGISLVPEKAPVPPSTLWRFNYAGQLLLDTADLSVYLMETTFVTDGGAISDIWFWTVEDYLMPDIATSEPLKFTAGSTVKWTKNLSDYLPADNWVLTYSFYNSVNQYTITATDNGDGTHLVDIDAATSAGFVAGEYLWQSFVTLATERYDVETGDIRIDADAAAGAVDGRSHVKKTLDAINLTIEQRAAQQNESYSVADTSVTKRSTADLLELQVKYQAYYAKEQKEEALKKGQGHSSRVRVYI